MSCLQVRCGNTKGHLNHYRLLIGQKLSLFETKQIVRNIHLTLYMYNGVAKVNQITCNIGLYTVTNITFELLSLQLNNEGLHFPVSAVLPRGLLPL